MPDAKLMDTQLLDAHVPPPDRILVVDDDPMIRIMLKEVLTPHGYHVDLSDGSGDALEKLIDYNYNLLLLDANMPGISGFELLKYCKKHHPDMEIIMITGNPEIKDAISTVKDGAFDYLTKPFAVDRLLERVRDAIQTQKQKVKNISRDVSLPGNESSNTNSPLPGYKILRTLGSGTMGVVLLVERNGVKYALKILRKASDEAIHEARVRRFLQEADILSKIDHPNVVKIYASGFPKNNDVPFILMEYVEGRSLTDIIKKGNLSFDERLSIIEQVAKALEVVHDKDVLHRDVKPGNILVTQENVAKLSDFGIAKIADSELTMTHEVIGSPAYMPPEAFNAKAVPDCRSDIFSLGVLSYELLTGTKPFHGETVAEMMGAIQKLRPVEPRKLTSEIPKVVQNILEKMLEKNPDDRYSKAGHIIDDLRSYRERKILSHKSPLTKRFRHLFGKGKIWE